MTQFPVIPLTPEQQRRLSLELYARMDSQVKSYNASRGVPSTSVSTETARALMESMRYTLEAAGGYFPGADVSELLVRGQTLLEERLEQAKELLNLVEATGPSFQTRYYSETLRRLRRFLTRYDHLHLAHAVPGGLDYPLLIPVPEALLGIDYVLFYVNCLWSENQLLHPISPDALSELTDAAPPDYWAAPQNLCEQVLLNAMAATLLGRKHEPLILSGDEPERLSGILRGMDRDQLRRTFTEALARLCGELHIPPRPARYAGGVIDQLLPRLSAALPAGNLSTFFW